MLSNRRSLLIVIAALALIAAACGSDSADDESVVAEEAPVVEDPVAPETDDAPAEEPEAEPGDPAPEDIPVSDLPGVPLQVTSIDFATGVATLSNVGTEQYDITGHWLCNRPNYAPLPDQILGPGETLDVGIAGFSGVGGEVAIYTSNNFGSIDDIVTYVGWGAGGGRQRVAEGANIWSGDTVQPAGDVITLTGDPGSAAGWS